MIDGERWFVGKDITAVLGYKKEHNAIQKRVDNEDALKWGIVDFFWKNAGNHSYQ